LTSNASQSAVTDRKDSENRVKYQEKIDFSFISEMQPIFDLILWSKIRLNEQNAKELAFFCFFVCGYKRQRHRLVTLLPIDAFEAFII